MRAVRVAAAATFFGDGATRICISREPGSIRSSFVSTHRSLCLRTVRVMTTFSSSIMVETRTGCGVTSWKLNFRTAMMAVSFGTRVAHSFLLTHVGGTAHAWVALVHSTARTSADVNVSRTGTRSLRKVRSEAVES